MFWDERQILCWCFGLLGVMLGVGTAGCFVFGVCVSLFIEGLDVPPWPLLVALSVSCQ